MNMYKLMILVIGLVLLSACNKAENTDKESEIYLVRHFQKQAATQQSGKDVALTNEGLINAKRLAAQLENKEITTIYSTNYKRTKQSAAGLSELIDIPISDYDPRELEAFAAQILTSEKNQLVVGHSNTTGVLFGLLGCETIILSENDYGDIMVVRRLHSKTATTLLACSNYRLPPQAPIINNLLFVKQSNLHDYFKQENAAFTINSVLKTEATKNGLVEVGFVIDENGATSNFEIVKSSPAGSWHAQALNAAQQLMFSPTSNRLPEGKSIYTTWVFEFTAI